jgi:cobalamin synthase
LILLLKLFLVPALIYAVTLVGRKWGPGVAGWMSAFPIMSGPILLTVTLEQGAAFAARAAEGTLLAVVAVLVFSVVYAWVAERAAARLGGVGGGVAGAALAGGGVLRPCGWRAAAGAKAVSGAADRCD